MKSNFSLEKLFLLNIFCCIATGSIAQKTAIDLNAYSGIFSYRSSGSASVSNIETGMFDASHTRDVHGRNNSFSFAVEVQATKKTGTGFLYGAGLGYERLASSVKIDTITSSGDPAYLQYTADGKTRLTNSYLTLNPFAGKRFQFNKISFDLVGGIDLAFCLSSHEKGTATTIAPFKVTATTDVNRIKPSLDLRPRIQLKAAYKRTGILLGYSLGLTKYQGDQNSSAYSGFIRMGISYTLR